MITREQSITLQRLICTLVNEYENISGTVAGSYSRNETFLKQKEAADELREFINTVTEKA